MTSQLLKLLAILLTLFFLVMGFITLTGNQAVETVAAQPTITAGSTETAIATIAPPETATPTATYTASATASPTHAATATSTVTASPTVTATDTPASTETLIATETPASDTVNETPVLTATPAPTDTPSGPPTDTPTPTVTPTPVPRTVRADDAPDFTVATPHLWFTRPFTDEFATWGSWWYPYGTNNHGEYLWHRGNDIQNPEGAPIIAVGDGLVVFADRDTTRAVGPSTDFYGQAVVIQHNRGITTTAEPNKTLPVFTLYGHVSKVLVKEGDTVTTGQPIALVGQEGVALGPHLHLEVRLGKNSYLTTQNPDLWERPDPGYGIIAGRVVDANGFYVPQQSVLLYLAAAPDKFWRETHTYPDHRYTPDPALGETFTFADVKTGEYIVKTSFDGQVYAVPVTVKNEEISFVLMKGSPAPTARPPTPEATPTPHRNL